MKQNKVSYENMHFFFFKIMIKKEKYFSVINNADIRKCFIAFRISAHKLDIEVGR